MTCPILLIVGPSVHLNGLSWHSNLINSCLCFVSLRIFTKTIYILNYFNSRKEKLTWMQSVKNEKNCSIDWPPSSLWVWMIRKCNYVIIYPCRRYKGKKRSYNAKETITIKWEPAILKEWVLFSCQTFVVIYQTVNLNHTFKQYLGNNQFDQYSSLNITSYLCC